MKRADWRYFWYQTGQVFIAILSIVGVLFFIYSMYMNHRDGCHGSLPCEADQTWGQ